MKQMFIYYVLFNIVFFSIFASCGGLEGPTDFERHYIEKGNCNYAILVIDSCEYVRGHETLAHKGNCIYCKQRRDSLIKDLKEYIKNPNKSDNDFDFLF